MPWFRTFVRGENFRMDVTGELQRLGLYTTRFVEVEALEKAEDAAVALIREDPKLKDAVLNDRSDPPMIFVERIEQVSESDLPAVAQGFTFFPEEE